MPPQDSSIKLESTAPPDQTTIQLIQRTTPIDKFWEKKSIADYAPHPCVGCGSFLSLFACWVIAIAAAIILLILGATEDYNSLYIAGGIVIGLVTIVAIGLLMPVLCHGLPCTLPKPPTERYPFCSIDMKGNIAPKSTPTGLKKIDHTQVYIIYNPNSLTANTPKLLNDIVLPLLDEKSIKYTLLETKYAGHARDYAKSASFDGYSSIIVMGGDGSLFDTINGLLVRDDKQNIPIGLLPCGSGNSFCADLGTWDFQKALNNFINGYVQDCDVNHVQDYLSILQQQDKELRNDLRTETAAEETQLPKSRSRSKSKSKSQNNTTATTTTTTTDFTLAEIDSDFPYPAQYPLNLYSINTCAYGLIGDLAVGAERCRWLGTQRYQICGLWGLCKKGYYPTTVIYDHNQYSNTDYTMSKSLTKPTTKPASMNQSDRIIIDSDDYITAFANHTKFFGKGHYISPYSYLNDGYADVTIAKATGRGFLTSIFNQIPSGSHVMIEHPTLNQFKTLELALIAYKDRNSDGMCSKSMLYPELRQYHDGLLEKAQDKKGANTTTTTTITTTAPTTTFKSSDPDNTSTTRKSSDPNQQPLTLIKDISNSLLPLPLSSSTNSELSSRSPILDYACQISEKYKSELAQSFITVDGEIYAYYAFLYIKTIKAAFQIFVDPESTSLQDAAAKFQES